MAGFSGLWSQAFIPLHQGTGRWRPSAGVAIEDSRHSNSSPEGAGFAPVAGRPAGRGAAMARARIRLTYLWRHGRLPDLSDPRRFTELVQTRKLNDRDPRMPPAVDKVHAKRIAAERLGDEWVIPTLWRGVVLPEAMAWEPAFVVKSRHRCNQRAFVRTGEEDWAAIRRRAARRMRRPYGGWLDGWAYRGVARGLLVEPFVGTSGVLPVDYKFYVFGGRVGYVQVHLDRERAHRWLLFDPAWRRVSAATPGDDPRPPRSLAAMIAAAEALGEGRDFVRVDFYEVAGRPLFGEMTFYPGSGLDRFAPVTLDAAIGARWLAAGAAG